LKPLSFVIITYNRPDDMLALAKNIAALDRAADLLEEVIVVNNASTASYAEFTNFIDSVPHIPFRYILSGENLGVARGRNFALKQGRAPLVIMLDDDAEMGNADCLVKLLEVFDRKDQALPKAIVSFKVLYFENRQMQVNAFPHKDFHRHKDSHFLSTYYYAGGAHAIRREALEKVGLYPEDFFYGMEEYDLSYRILNAGYAIVYTDEVIMLHKESPLGRQPKREKLAQMWVNKATVAWRYLPKRYFWSTAAMWSFEYLRKTGFHLQGFLQGWKKVLAIPGKENRTPVNKSTMAYLRAADARLWY
jgi:GT2 family glycosyltransferase